MLVNSLLMSGIVLVIGAYAIFAHYYFGKVDKAPIIFGAVVLVLMLISNGIDAFTPIN